MIHPGEFCLGRTLEWVELPDDIVARIEGNELVGRLGLIVHATAGFCDPGWKGTLTLELNNLTRVPDQALPGAADRAAVVHDARPAGAAAVRQPGLGSHYQGQRAATESRYEGPARPGWRGSAERARSAQDRIGSRPCYTLLLAAGEPSKVPFYMPAARWLSGPSSWPAIGLTRPELPVRRTRRRAG